CTGYLFLSCQRSSPALHSFPTRRSSDLQRRELLGVLVQRAAGGARQLDDPREHRALDVLRLLPVVVELLAQRERLLRGLPRLLRSEEHTSELQSRFDLVCRLLLEKKKLR